MIQAQGFAHLSASRPRYAARAFAADEGARLPRALQSAGAGALLDDLRVAAGVESGPSSKAHSRHWGAAALARQGRVGIDLEYCTPQRPIREIAAWLMGSAPPSAAAAWRVFTFYEAHFKAFGETPTPAQMHIIAQTDAPLTRLPEGFGVLHIAPALDFVLALVWTTPAAPERIAL